MSRESTRVYSSLSNQAFMMKYDPTKYLTDRKPFTHDEEMVERRTEVRSYFVRDDLSGGRDKGPNIIGGDGKKVWLRGLKKPRNNAPYIIRPDGSKDTEMNPVFDRSQEAL